MKKNIIILESACDTLSLHPVSPALEHDNKNKKIITSK